MKAQIISSYGDHNIFQLQEISKPIPSPGQILIKVKATSVNPIDTKIRSGLVPAISPDLPAVLHGDVAGIVAEVGEGVTAFKVGDEVFGCAGGFKGTGGALAEYMLADPALLAHKPKNVTMEEAAALPLVSITAWEALVDRAKLKHNQNILIHGGTGGVGHIAVQLAKWLGATVYTTVSTKEKEELASNIGADYVINYKNIPVKQYVHELTEDRGFDVVFDTVGGKNLDSSFEAAALNGTVLAIAARSTHDLSPLHSKGLTLHVVFMLLKIIDQKQRHLHGEILQKIRQLVEEGHIRPLIDQKSFTFDQVNEAHAYLETNKAIGKIVLKNTWS